MIDRIANIVLGLQRLMEETHIRGKDIRHAQQQEDAEHLKVLNELLGMVQRLHSALIDDIREFAPPVEEVPYQLNKAKDQQAIPKIVQKGPAT